MDINEQAFTYDGHQYSYDVNTRYSFTPNVEKLVVWDVNHNIVGEATIDHNLEQIHIEAHTDGQTCSVDYFQYDRQAFNYEDLSKQVIVAAIY